MNNQKATSGFSLKDHLFNRQKIGFLSDCFSKSDAEFDAKTFQKMANKGLRDLELKQRIVHIAESLEQVLSPDFTTAAKQIINALPPALDPKKTDDDFGDFIIAPLGEFVVRNGLDKRRVRTSLKTLRELTKRFSMEDAIRYFINEFPEETLTHLGKWALDKNYHVRRLVSEGTRPRLPWSGRISIEPKRALKLLDHLYADPTRYVTRSVANHLNDIAKTDPPLVLKTLRRWRKSKEQKSAEMDWITKHSLRTLVKQGNAPALEMLGFHPDPKIEVSNFEIAGAPVRPGEAIEFEFTLKSNANESLVVDYVIDFVKANGTRAPKVHKIKQLTIGKGDELVVRKRHPFRANATTFTLYPGTHKLTLQINGKPFDQLEFEMLGG